MSATEDHPILNVIATKLKGSHCGISHVHRASESVEFYDTNQLQWFELAVRPIDEPEEDS